MIKEYLVSNAHRYASKWLVLIIDVCMIAVSFVLSYLIRFNLTLDFDIDKLFIQLPIISVIAAAAFLFTGSHKGVVRHTGIRDVYNIFNAICLCSILLITIVLFNRELGILEDFTVPLSIIVIHSLLSFIALTASRYVFKSLYDNLMTHGFRTNKNVLIYGAGESGILTQNALANHSKSKVRVVGYVDEDDKKLGKSINGVKVFPKAVLNREFLLRNRISEVIFSMQNIDPKKLKDMVESLVDYPVQVKIVPPVEQWINGELKASQIKQIQIEDLLDRAPISIRNSKISQEVRDKVILVTGGAGSIGSEIVRQICTYSYKSLIIIDQSESALYDLQQELKQNGFHNFLPIVGDVRDKNRLNNIFQEHKPNIIFHA
ncbi:MAG TPA: SDR family NAD(P)-dependent oxidoreductase, partial [Pricia sp.]|nr:SDR family NAD(P)-dependent oxidoreductase [Pricia sp.]